MNQALQVFEFKSQTVRTVLIEGEPWFVARDIFTALDMAWAGAQSLDKIKSEWKQTQPLVESGQNAPLWMISEPAVYKLAFRSNKPEAERFTDWVAAEVLPAIRKAGSFTAIPDDPDERALVLASTVQRLIGEKRQLQAQIETDAPKVEGFENFLSAAAAVSLDDLAKTLGYKPRQFTDHLKKIGVLMRDGKPYAVYANKGWFRIIQVDISKNGSGWWKQQVLVEGVGQEGIYQLLKRKPVFAQEKLFASAHG